MFAIPVRRRMLLALPALLLLPPVFAGRHPVEIQTLSGTQVSVAPDGSFFVTTGNPVWTFGGSVGGPASGISSQPGHDGAGYFEDILFEYNVNGVSASAAIRAYRTRPVVVFRTTLLAAAGNSPLFPRISTYPQGMYKFGFNFTYGYQYGPWGQGPDSPWAYFDAAGDTFIVSPASHFPIAANVQDSQNAIVAGINTGIPSLPAGFTQETMLVFGHGINATFDLWGQALTDLQGKKRPSQDSDPSLASLGYWTDSGSKYYYNYVGSLGYEGTLSGVKQDFAQNGLPVRSMQLDSWWYPKGNPPAWNNSGDTLNKGQYLLQADPAILPDGLGGVHRLLGGIPLLVHARWLDPSSPARQQYQMSGNVSIDPQYWSGLAAYLASNGVMTYEQDWLAMFAQPNLNLTDPETYLDNMAHAMGAAGITLQYCGQTVGQTMQGAKYNNLTTARVSQDGFNPARWDPFLYNARLTSSLGIFPFADNVYSSDIRSLILATHSAGILAAGDAMGSEVAANLLQAIRADGIVVKPDTPMVPLDSTYLADARAELQNAPPPPMLAVSYSNHGGLKTAYLFGYSRAAGGGAQPIAFSPGDLAIDGPMFVYDYFAQTGQLIGANGEFNAPVATGGSYFIAASVGPSGIGLLGDTNKFVSAGRQRFAAIEDNGILSASLEFAPGEVNTSIQGYSPTAPAVTAAHGTVGLVSYDPARHIFTIVISPAEDMTARVSISRS